MRVTPLNGFIVVKSNTKEQENALYVPESNERIVVSAGDHNLNTGDLIVVRPGSVSEIEAEGQKVEVVEYKNIILVVDKPSVADVIGEAGAE